MSSIFALVASVIVFGGSFVETIGVPKEYFESAKRETLARRERLLSIAETAKPVLRKREVRPVRQIRVEKDKSAFQGCRAVTSEPAEKALNRHLWRGKSILLDFGEHLVGRVKLAIKDSPGHVMDAPLRLKLVMAEMPNELIEEPPSEWKNALSRAWVQDEIVNLDFTPGTYELPRRYAFRYLKIEVVAAQSVMFDSISAIAETSADESQLLAWRAPDGEAAKIDRVALNTLRDCMQTMLEDGPKRDRRLWLGDLRLQALANYVSYRNYDIVKRCMCLLAGTANDDGRVSTDCYEQPFPKRGGCAILDYTALFPTVVLEYLEACGDRATAEELWPVCVRQMALVLDAVGDDAFMLPKNKWWNLIDHGQPEPLASEQGVIVYGLKRFCQLAERLGKSGEVKWARKASELMTAAARARMWKEARGLFVSPWRERASEMLQAWMVLSGIADGDRAQRCLKAVLDAQDVDRHVSPYGYHYFIDALYTAGLNAEGEKRLREYWGGMVSRGADTFWECFVPGNDFANSCGHHLVASYCHAWSCTPLYFLRRTHSRSNLSEFPLNLARARKCTKAPATARLEGEEYVLDNGADKTAYNGISWHVPLNQTMAMPFAFTGESLFEEGTEGSATRGYSLYLDVRYVDGSSLYGQAYSFNPRKGRGWQKGTVTVCPDKPVSSVSCYYLLRHRDGRARFRAPRVKTFTAKDGIVLFDTTPTPRADVSAAPALLINDAAADSGDWKAVTDGSQAHGVKVAFKSTVRDSAEFFEVNLTTDSDADRALTAIYSIPLPDGNLEWLDDPRTVIAMGKGQYRNTIDIGCGAGLSCWPFGAVRVGSEVLALGYDPDAPAVFRVVANGELRQLFIAFDVALAKEKKDAHFKFVRFRSKGEDGFRGALIRYAELFPEAFRVRIKKHGIWMAFRPISKVEGFEDFGFGIKEGHGEPAWDDAHGILTTHYTEPTSWWMNIKSTNSVTLADAIAIAEAEVRKPKAHPYSKAWQACTYRNADGDITGAICDRPWCKGCIWNLNPLPAIPGGEYSVKQSAAEYAQRYNGKVFPQGVDGEYIDSAECHLPPRIDFNRANFQYSKTPLCWSPSTKRPGVSTALAIYEYVRGTADRVHAMGRIMQANGVPYTWPWLIPFVDYGGQETKWIERGEGKWSPMKDRELLYRMALSYGKPYCFLMNVKFENMTDEMVEKYFQRCLAYGLMSSFFSPNASEAHYFTRPELYNRHRKFFLKYGKLQRMISEAGWRPINRLVASSSPKVFVEQFGDRYVTVFNSSTTPQKTRLKLLGATPSAFKELVTGTEWKFKDGSLDIELPPETCRLLEIHI